MAALLVAAVALGALALRKTTDSDAAASPSVDSIRVQAHANRVFERFHGTQRQRNAGGVLQAYALNGAMDRCMEQAGVPSWDWSATRNTAPRVHATATSVFFSEPMGRQIHSR